MSVKNNIKNAILNFGNDNFFENSIELFKTLGYKSTRRIDLPTKEDFKNFVLQREFNEDKVLYTEWKNAEFLFELRTNELNTNDRNITTDMVDNTAIEAYWFVAIELSGTNYTKKQLSDITREINKQRPMPVFILFKYADKLTFSIIDRRLNKTDETKDVLEKIVLIKDININHTHRAHIDILSSIAFENLNVDSFAELHKNWLKALSVSELNKKFYTELSNWFFWTMDTCQLSKDNTVKDNVMFGIRMVTRIIFDWFIKEKGLVSEKVFDKQTYLDLLKPEYKEQGDLYYKVVLQNLFFGCLSKPMDRREFRSEDRFQGKNTGYDVNNLFRYAKYLNNPQEVVEMFKDIPFLNGGLFECTDDKRNGKYIDCFTDNDSRNFLKLSDDIFFMEDEKIVDLSSHFDGNKGYKNAKVRGLFPILNSYKFTIDETTPVEEEIALDPELLGRVFENLLAAHNPETKTTARKSTGSYYTPREIVDYMCEQSLINYLKTKVEHLSIVDLDDKLEELLSYSETHSFSEFEVDELIKAVNEVKILDPACGSGAFPMGLLHKLVHILSKLDPHNLKWKESQIEKASQIDDIEAREEAIKIIEKQFNDNEMDYSRKLYLIQNCIFGVDIQPIATQISRLRFFISLIVDETPNQDRNNNMGILALPNLETKFVAANTLIDLPQNNLFSTFPTIVKLREELEKVRAMHFRANSSRKKTEIQNKDNEIRMKIKQESITMGATFESAAKLADWSPYDKDYSSDWFNPKWMFNVEKFDIVIGNPPYVSEANQNNNTKLAEQRAFLNKSKYYETLCSKWDLYIPFMEKGLKLLLPNGCFSMIVPYPLTNQIYAKKIRESIISDYNLFEISDLSGNKVFENATVTNCIPFISNNRNSGKCYISHYSNKRIKKSFEQNNSKMIQDEKSQIWNLTQEERKSNAHSNLNVLGDFCYISKGMVLHSDERIAKNEFKKTDLISENYDNIHCKQYIEAKDIEKYNIKKVHYLEWNTDRCPAKVSRPTFVELYENDKLITNCLGDLIVTIDYNHFYCEQSNRVCILWHNLHNVNNKSISTSIKKFSNYSRGEMENLSTKINLEYLAAILNSKYGLKLLNNLRGGDYHVVPEHIRNIPIPIPTDNFINKITNMVKNLMIQKSKKESTHNIESDIDIMIYKLYELTYDEVKTIDNEFTMSEAEYNSYQI